MDRYSLKVDILMNMITTQMITHLTTMMVTLIGVVIVGNSTNHLSLHQLRFKFKVVTLVQTLVNLKSNSTNMDMVDLRLNTMDLLISLDSKVYHLDWIGLSLTLLVLLMV